MEVEDIKEELKALALDTIREVVEGALEDDTELSHIYKTPCRDDLILEVNHCKPSAKLLAMRRLGGMPEPYLTADEWLGLRFWCRDPESSGVFKATARMMRYLGMDKEAARLEPWIETTKRDT